MTTNREAHSIRELEQTKQIIESNHQHLSALGQPHQHDPSEGTKIVPIHLSRLNSRSSLTFDSGMSSDSSKLNSVSKSKSSKSNSSWRSVEDLVYPGIPFQVARYLCETSPDLLDRMAATLHDTERIKLSNKSVSTISPLLHLSCTTDALSLQESVIGGKKCISKVSIPIGSGEIQVSSTTHMEAAINSSIETNGDLRRVPSQMVTTSVEKRSWFNIGKDENGHPNNNRHVNDETTRESSRGSHLELKSDYGSNYELDSNCEVQSNISETSGFEEEMFRIKKLLLESPRSVSGDDFSQQQLDLLREKAALEGRVDALAMELSHVVNERAQLLAELNSLKSQFQTQTQANSVSNSVQTEIVKDLKRQIKDSRNKIGELDETILKLQTHLENASEELIHARVELKESENEMELMKTTVGDLKVETEMKDGAVRGLKFKVTELHVQLESALQAKSIVESDLHASKAQVKTEQEMKEWYRSQLQQAKSDKSKLQQKVISLDSALAENESSVEKMRFERDQCKRNLADITRKSVTEKEALLRQLENIEADVRERESTYKELSRDVGGVDELVLNRLKKLEDERTLLNEERYAASELGRQLEMSQMDSQLRLTAMNKMETEAAQFMKQLTVFQKTVSEKEMDIHQSLERCSELEAKQKEQQAAIVTKDEILNKLKQEKVALEVQLRSAREEKLEMDNVISEVKANVAIIEARTRNMREELNQKSEAIGNFEKENAVLKENLRHMKEMDELWKVKAMKMESELFTTGEELKARREKEPRLQEGVNSLSDQLLQLQGENALFRDKISILEKYSLNSGTTQDLLNNINSARFSNESEIKLKEKLILRDEEVRKLIEIESTNEKKLQSLERKLRESLKVKAALEEELKQFRTSSNENSVTMSSSRAKDGKITYYRKKLIAMEAKLNDSLRLFEEERKRADKNQESLLELERQKGKLHAMAESSSILKQQTTHLESTLSATEETVLQLHQINSEIMIKKQEDEESLKEKLNELNAKLKFEQDAVKETRKLMFKEKCESNTLKKQLTITRNALQDANRLLESKEILLSESQTKIDHNKLSMNQGISEAADLRFRLTKNQDIVEKFQKEVEENQAKDSLLADQIKTLGWHLQQKKQELIRIQQQTCAAQERHEEELRGINEILSKNQRDIELLRNELQQTTKEKLLFQAKVTELRSAIKNTLEKSKAQQLTGMRLPDSPPSYDENLISNLLQQSLVLPECRPLSNLQVCVKNLKQEMAILQQQLLERNTGNGAV